VAVETGISVASGGAGRRGIGLAIDNFMNLDWDGRVYDIDPKAMNVVRTLDRKIWFTNSIAFGPDNKLYANASFTGEVYSYDVFGQTAPKRVLFGNVLQPDDRPVFKGPDGMKFGMDGRLYCTVAAGRYSSGNMLSRTARKCSRMRSSASPASRLCSASTMA
jgi:sugar lactone lactonase YvrE